MARNEKGMIYKQRSPARLEPGAAQLYGVPLNHEIIREPTNHCIYWVSEDAADAVWYYKTFYVKQTHKFQMKCPPYEKR